jgi:hypothetical protein
MEFFALKSDEGSNPPDLVTKDDYSPATPKNAMTFLDMPGPIKETALTWPSQIQI